METRVERLTFRVKLRGQDGECGGRILEDEDGYRLEVQLGTPEHPDMRLEVAPVAQEAALWPLLRRLCEHRGITLHAMRRDGAGAGFEPLPG